MYLCSPIPRCHDGINPYNRGTANIRGVAQLASASGLGPEGPVFESQYPDIETETDLTHKLYTTNPLTLLQEGVSVNYFLNKSE